MKKTGISAKDRPVIDAALEKARVTGAPAAAMQMPDGSIVLGKTSSLLGAASALLLNALKHFAGIPKEVELISPNIIEAVQHLKVDHLGNRNPRLHTDELLIALTISAATYEPAALAMDYLDKLEGCDAHSSVILTQVDVKTIKKLGINLTCEPCYQVKKLYHAK